MIKNVLKGVAVVLAVSEIIALWFVLTLAEPYGRLPGGRLSGDEATGPVSDWSFAMDSYPLILEVRPSDPYSVHTSRTVHKGNLYVSSIIGGDSRWAQLLLEDPDLRIRSGDKIYKVRATKVEDQTLLDEIHEVRSRRPGAPTRTPEELARMWFFRIDSR